MARESKPTPEQLRREAITHAQGGMHAADQWQQAEPPPLKGAKPVGK